MVKIKYLISSNKNYYNITVPRLLKSLIESGINKEDIFIAVSGADNETFFTKNNVLHKYTTGNSFDLTSLIESVKHDLFKEYTYFFLLHDTCEVGIRFKTNVEMILEEFGGYTIPLFKNYISSNIGVYYRPYLMDNIDKILEMENHDKTWYVLAEDKLIDERTYAFGTSPLIKGVEKIYSDEVLREVNYCKEIDLYKYKANWYMKDIWTNKA